MSENNSSKAGPVVLKGDGRYGFTATVDGNDIVVRGVHATWFGGAHDPQDNGETASGVNTKRYPKFRGCALPMNGHRMTKGSPLPDFPYLKTRVAVTRQGSKLTIDVPVIDLGPSAPPLAHAAIDLTVAAFQELGGSLATGWMIVDFRVIGGAKYVKISDLGASAAPVVKPLRGAASGSVGLAVPFVLTALVMSLPKMVAESPALSPEVVTVVVGLLGLAGMAKIVTGLLVDAKKLREKPPEHSQLPNPVVVRSADQFASQEQVQKIETDLRNQMKELRSYVHEAVHVINQSVGRISEQLHEQGEATQEFFTRLDAKNEARVQRIAERVDEVIDRTPEKIIGLLKTTGVIKS